MINGCLTDHDLDRLHGRETTPEEAAAFLAHLDACPACAQRDAKMVDQQNRLVRQLRGLSLAEITFENSNSSGMARETGPSLTGFGGSSSESMLTGDAGLPHGGQTDFFPMAIEGVRLVREIQRGGQGIVYEGFQEWPRRRVAVKVLRDSMLATPLEHYRIEQEIEVLGRLHHPGIVAIHYSGTCEAGRYYVMDYIEGIPLDAWMAEPRRGRQEKLEAFAAVCDVVHAAHLQGVLHRDLKPANILIDAEGKPHVLDFGLAKLAQSDLAGSRGVTNTGVFLGTLAWASPEQLQNTRGVFDLRSDVYSLGVLLYQAMVGEFPYDVSGSVPETMHHILNTDPSRPRSVAMPVDGELQAILFKCLEKEPSHRYQSAGELAAELRRYLRGETVEAKRHSTLYTLKKIAGRHKAVVSLATVLIVALIGSTIALTYLYQQASASERRAEAARTEAVSQRDRAEQASYQAFIGLASQSIDELRFDHARDLLASCAPAYRNWEWGWLMHLCHEDRMTMLGHEGPVHEVAFSPDGKWLASGGQDSTVRIWDTATGSLLRTIKGHDRSVDALAISPDGRWVASGGLETRVIIWDATTGELVRRIENLPSTIFTLTFSPDGDRLAIGFGPHQTEGRDALIWDLATDREMMRLQGHTGQVCAVAFSPCGRWMATGSTDMTVKVWDARTGEMLSELPRHKSAVFSVAFSPDGHLLATADARWWDGKKEHGGREAILWDFESREQLAKFNVGYKGALCLAFSPDGRTLATTSEDRVIRLHDVESCELMMELRGHANVVPKVAFSPAGRLLASASRDGTLKLWELDDAEQPQLRTIPAPGYRYNFAAFTADGRNIVASGQHGASDHRVRIYDSGTLSEMPVEIRHDGLYSAAVSPAGNRLATGARDGTLCMWSLEPVERLWERKVSDQPLRAIAFSPDGGHLVASIDPGVTDLLATSTGETAMKLEDIGDLLAAPLAFSHDGGLLAAGLEGPTLAIWDLATGRLRYRIRDGARTPWSLDFSPDDRLLYSANLDGVCRVWDLLTGSQIRRLEGHASEVNAIDVSPDGNRLATTGADRTTKIWDTNTWTELLTLKDTNDVGSVTFSPDGQRLATVCADGSIVIRSSWPSEHAGFEE